MYDNEELPFGFDADDYDPVEVWPENWRSVLFFQRIQTQWMVGMGGATGLRYEAVYPLLDREADDRQEWDELFSDVQIMEAAALKQMAAARKKTK